MSPRSFRDHLPRKSYRVDFQEFRKKFVLFEIRSHLFYLAPSYRCANIVSRASDVNLRPCATNHQTSRVGYCASRLGGVMINEQWIGNDTGSDVPKKGIITKAEKLCAEKHAYEAYSRLFRYTARRSFYVSYALR